MFDRSPAQKPPEILVVAPHALVPVAVAVLLHQGQPGVSIDHHDHPALFAVAGPAPGPSSRLAAITGADAAASHHGVACVAPPRSPPSFIAEVVVVVVVEVAA